MEMALESSQKGRNFLGFILKGGEVPPSLSDQASNSISELILVQTKPLDDSPVTTPPCRGGALLVGRRSQSKSWLLRRVVFELLHKVICPVCYAATRTGTNIL
jgi:hypothetical protein